MRFSEAFSGRRGRQENEQQLFLSSAQKKKNIRLKEHFSQYHICHFFSFGKCDMNADCFVGEIYSESLVCL